MSAGYADDYRECRTCDGRTWMWEHAPGCAGWTTGGCNCAGSQVLCPTCAGRGIEFMNHSGIADLAGCPPPESSQAHE